MTYKHTIEAKKKISENNARYWLGKKRSKETIEKVRLANTGRVYKNRRRPNFNKPNIGWFRKGLLPWNKGTKGLVKRNSGCFTSKRMSGKNNPSWKGGITPFMHLLRKSDAYKLWRKSVLSRCNYTCYDCGVRGGKLEAHHIMSFRKYPLLRFSVENGVALCVSCHAKIKRPDKEIEWFNNYVDKRLEFGIHVVDI